MKTPWHVVALALVLTCWAGLPAGCDSSSAQTDASEARASASTAAATPPTASSKTPTASPQAWRALPLGELCKDWKGAYYPPEGHTPEDTPGASIPGPGIACGWRPVGWDGQRVLPGDLSPGDLERTLTVWQRAWELLNLPENGGDLTAAGAMEVLEREYTFEHIGLGEVRGMGTLHFTLPSGAPVVVWPGRWERPDGDMPLHERIAMAGQAHPPGARLYERCAYEVGPYWPPPGHTPMDVPDALLLERGDLCGVEPPRVLAREVDEATRRKEAAARARIRELLDEQGKTPEQVAAILREEFDGFVLLNHGSPNVGITFRFEGGTTQATAPARHP